MSVRADILSGLQTALEAVIDNSNYDVVVSNVEMFDKNVSTFEDRETPAIIAIDLGNEQLRVRDATHYLYSTEFYLRGFVRQATNQTIHAELNKMIATIKEFIHNAPSIDSSVKKITYLGSDRNAFDDGGGKQQAVADVLIRMQLIYVCTAGSF